MLKSCFALLVAAGALVCCQSAVQAQGDTAAAEAFEKTLKYQSGTVTLRDGIASVRLPETFRFLDEEGARRLLVQGWGNPPGAAEGVLGMLIPNDSSPVSKEGWGIVVTYDEDGYVSDTDAASIDYTELLTEMREGTAESNKERKKQGFAEVQLVGWAEQPSYDARTHKMYWAKELAFNDSPEHTLNYSIRVLGRRGVLVLNAVASMDQLPVIRTTTRDVLTAVDFNDGHRYTDYLPGKDKAAAYGLTGLIVGATAAKAGFFKVIWLAILASKKLIIIGLVALFALLKRLFGRKQEAALPPSIPPPPLPPPLPPTA